MRFPDNFGQVSQVFLWNEDQQKLRVFFFNRGETDYNSTWLTIKNPSQHRVCGKDLEHQLEFNFKWEPKGDEATVVFSPPYGPAASGLRAGEGGRGRGQRRGETAAHPQMGARPVAAGDNTRSKSDPLTILQEAGAGKRFRCVEYAIVTAACARTLGMPSRVLSLKREDVETAASGAGHVVTEVWLDQFRKWVFVEGQWDAMPERDGIPLNAVEFQDAIAHNATNLLVRSSSGINREAYLNWITPYLYYFQFSLDQRFSRENYSDAQRNAAQPKVFQRKTPIKNCTYISNPGAFYPQMEGAKTS